MAYRPFLIGLAAFLVASAAAPADVALPFDAFAEQRQASGILHQTTWPDVVARPDSYRGRMLGYLVRVKGRIDARDEARLIAADAAGDLINLICPGGASMGFPGQWIAVLGRIPDEGPVRYLLAAALTEIAEPQPEPAARSASESAPRGDVGVNATQGASLIVVGGPAEVPGAAQPTTTGSGQAPPETTGGGQPLAPLPAETLRERGSAPTAVPLPSGFDVDALRRLQRFILTRNSRIDANELNVISTELLRLCWAHRMRWEFFASLIAAESNFHRRAVSSAGAMGLGQLMPFNCRTYGVGDPFDIRQNLGASAQHIREFLDKYSQLDAGKQFSLALACYNAGPGAVAKYGGVPPYNETLNYIKRIAALYTRLCAESAAAG